MGYPRDRILVREESPLRSRGFRKDLEVQNVEIETIVLQAMIQERVTNLTLGHPTRCRLDVYVWVQHEYVRSNIPARNEPYQKSCNFTVEILLISANHVCKSEIKDVHKVNQF
jgi:hypothetical protein